MVKTYFPKSLAEALDILANSDCYILSGGTDLMVLKRSNALIPPSFDKPVLFISQIDELKKIYHKEDGLHVGSGVTFTSLLNHPLTPSILKKIIQNIASSNIRNSATIAGNIANASPAGDSIVGDVLLDARLKLVSKSSIRYVDAKDFVLGVRRIDLKTDELIEEFIFPDINIGETYYKKVGSRKADSISKLSFAGSFLIKDNIIKDIRLVFGSVYIKVIRDLELENSLKGQNIEQIKGELQGIISKYMDLIKPISDIRSTKEYRLQVAKNILVDFFNKVVGE